MAKRAPQWLLAAPLVISIVAVVALYVFAGDRDPEANVPARAQAFEEKPNERNLVRLLGTRRDGASAYLHMAHVGRAFAQHPELFREVAESLAPGAAREAITQLAELGKGVFEYHPELEPTDFGARLGAADWLARFR